eukprot:1158171-Pelagomonas_calceolata.AAC.1
MNPFLFDVPDTVLALHRRCTDDCSHGQRPTMSIWGPPCTPSKGLRPVQMPEMEGRLRWMCSGGAWDSLI